MRARQCSQLVWVFSVLDFAVVDFARLVGPFNVSWVSKCNWNDSDVWHWVIVLSRVVGVYVID